MVPSVVPRWFYFCFFSCVPEVIGAILCLILFRPSTCVFVCKLWFVSSLFWWPFLYGPHYGPPLWSLRWSPSQSDKFFMYGFHLNWGDIHIQTVILLPEYFPPKIDLGSFFFWRPLFGLGGPRSGTTKIWTVNCLQRKINPALRFSRVIKDLTGVQNPTFRWKF